ncbi:MAG: thioredoxin-disulfide reductase [Lentisphaeria bacterium]|nr:thioredoxin-disulfide reductase [Lentisphaeria bacterium]
MMKQEKLVIVGSGPAGYTAAIYAARANLNPLVLVGTLPGGLLTQTTHVENFPGFPEGVTGFDLVMGMQQQAERFGARVEFDEVVEFELTDGGCQLLKLSSGETVGADALILATGASPRYLGIPSEERLRNKGVSACATCDGAFYQDVPVAVLGGGDSAMEEAMFLTRFASRVYVVHRRDELRASRIMAERARANPKIGFVWSSTVEEILGENKVTGLRVKNTKTGEVSDIECSAVFVALGHVPNTGLYRQFIDTDETGYVVLKDNSSMTKLKGVFAAGDCADPNYRQAITAAGMGCRAAIDAERYLECRHE